MAHLAEHRAFRGIRCSQRSARGFRVTGTECRRRKPCVVMQASSMFQLGDSWVVAPDASKYYNPIERVDGWVKRKPRIKGVVHFLGGAFAGAAPQIMYSLLLEMVAAAGYTVVATPYAVTFRHLDCANTVRRQFLRTVQALRDNADPAIADLAPHDAPLLGVGHSMGSLMHLLIGSSHPGTTAGNVLISYNNKQLSDAIPIPGFMATVAPTIAAVRTSPTQPPFPDASTVLRSMVSLLPPALRSVDEAGQLSRAALALDQWGSVFGEVGDGVTDFVPTPAESRALIQLKYKASRSPALFLQFSDDSTDETPQIVSMLQETNPSGVSSLTLPGTHVTPCGADVPLPWQPGMLFTPVDAIAQLAKWQSQSDVRRLSDTVVNYLDSVTTGGEWEMTNEQLARRFS